MAGFGVCFDWNWFIWVICSGEVACMIDYSDAEKALEFLKSTDKEAARAKARAEALDDAKKTVLALVYNEFGEGSADRNVAVC